MKAKIIILTVILASAVGAQAQYGSEYYHRTGDTIETYSEIAYYKWWDFDYMLSLGERIYIDGYPGLSNSPHVVATTYNTPAPLKIVGIAGCLVYMPGLSSITPSLPEYLYLFDATPNGPVYLDRSEIHFADSTPHRCLHVTSNQAAYSVSATDSCCGFGREERYFDLFECYFDSGITVTDSFHVGWSINNRLPNLRYMEVSLGIMGQTNIPCSELDSFPAGPGGSGSICYFPYIDYMFCDDGNLNANPEGSYTWTRLPFYSDFNRRFVLVYPLIQIDTTVPPAYMCDPVQNFSVTVLDTGSCCVFFTWDDFYHYSSCEVQYYSIEQGYNHAVTTTVTGNNMLHLCGFDSTLTYYARMRAICDTSKTETEWTSWVNFTFPHTNPQGIDAVPSKLDRYTHLMPNPAADKVTVTSELGLRRIEVYNARGILVYSEPAGYSATTIDLHGWPAGQYLMTIETLQGKTAKRLVVAK